MTIQITGHHFEVRDEHRKHIEKKTRRLVRQFDKIDEMSFVLAQDRADCLAEATFHAGHIHAFAKASDSNPLAAIDKTIDKLVQQTIKARDKLYGNKKNAGRVEIVEEEPERETA
jgi:ribosomal subunit interface protein